MITTDPLRVLHLTAGSDAGGVSRYLFDLCSAMHALGHDVRIAGEHGAWRGLFEKAPWPWIELPLKGNLPALWQSARRLRHILREHPADIIHAHYRRATLVARRIDAKHRSPILYTLHQPGISLAGPRRWLSDFGDFVHVPSEEAWEWLIESAGVPPERITLIPHGIDPGRFPVPDETTRVAARSQLGLPADGVIAAFVGRLDVPKNEEWILDVAAAAKGKLPDVRFLMAGDGPHEQAVRQRVAAERLGDRIKLLSYRDPLPVYHAADALLVPSLREGFCFAAVEAMCTGIPVLRTRTGGTMSQIVEDITGRSTPIDRNEFVTAALEFLADRNALRRMGHAAATHVRGTLTFELQLERTIAMYRRIAKSPAANGEHVLPR
jgi:glycosyltransferase involved in cell wall biosynthesis